MIRSRIKFVWRSLFLCLVLPLALAEAEGPPRVCSIRPYLIDYVATKEGYYADHNTLPKKLLNPCSLVYAHQRGAVPDRSGFARFEFEVDGFSACSRDITSKIRRKISLNKAWIYLDKAGRKK